jgi:hypothetical protein
MKVSSPTNHISLVLHWLWDTFSKEDPQNSQTIMTEGMLE